MQIQVNQGKAVVCRYVLFIESSSRKWLTYSAYTKIPASGIIHSCCFGWIRWCVKCCAKITTVFKVTFFHVDLYKEITFLLLLFIYLLVTTVTLYV